MNESAHRIPQEFMFGSRRHSKQLSPKCELRKSATLLRVAADNNV